MAAVPLRTLTLLFSAGWGGSYFYNHMDGAREALAGALSRTLRFAAGRDSRSDGSSIHEDGSAVDALSEQVSNLARDVSRAANRPVVVLGPNGSRVSAIADALSLAGWAVLVFSVGGAAYYVAIWKGWSVRDLAWVSQASFSETVSAMQEGIARVRGAVGAVRREVGERMRVVEARVEAVRQALSRQIEAEVCEVKERIDGVSADVSSVHDVLADVTGRIDAIDGKLDTATNGIMALVRVVSSLAPDSVRPENPFYDLKMLASENKSIMDSSPMMRRRISSGLSGILPTVCNKGDIDGVAAQDAAKIDYVNGISQSSPR